MDVTSSVFSESQFVRALYDVCNENGNIEAKRRGLNYIAHFFESKELLLFLLSFVVNECGNRLEHKLATACLINVIGRKNHLVRPMIRIFVINLKVPEKTNSMKKGFHLFVEAVVLSLYEPNQDNYQLVARLMMKYLNIENDPHLLELGSILLHALLKTMKIQLVLHEKYIAEGLQILLNKSKFALQENAEKSYILVYNTLMSATILGRHMSRISIVLQPLRNSLEEVLNLLKFIAIYGTQAHFNEVSELLKILLKHKQLSGNKWLLILKACECLCRSEEYQNFARIKTLKIFGNVLSVRRIYFQNSKIFHGLLITLIKILCQEPDFKINESSNGEQVIQLPTPLSIAADLLQFISNKYPKEEISVHYMRILLSSIKCHALSEWQFRGLFITLARILKRCGDCLNAMYVKELIALFRGGLTDISLNVRQAAVYALQKFFNYFFVECSYWAEEIFPAFLKNIGFLSSDIGAGNTVHPLHIERLFFTMKIFCDILDKSMINHLPLIAEIFEDLLLHIKEPRIIILTIEVLQEIIIYTGIAFSPYYNDIIISLRPYLINWDASEYDEVRVALVDLLNQIMMYATAEFIEINGYIVTEVVFTLLQIQYVRTNNYGCDFQTLLRYSPLRCSIFRFFGEIVNVYIDGVVRYMPQLLGTLLGTIAAIQFISKQELAQIGITHERPEFSFSSDIDDSKTPTRFKKSNNDELELARFFMTHECFTLADEIFTSLVTLQYIIDSATLALQPYAEFIFSKLCQLLKYPYEKLRKQFLYTVNIMLEWFLSDFHFSSDLFLDKSIIEVISLIEMEIDYTIIGESVHAFLIYVAIKEKYHEAMDDETHVYLLNMMDEIFNTIILLPKDGVQSRKKNILLNQVIAFMPKLLKICSPRHFNNYFSVFLRIFDAKINLPIYRSPISDRKRTNAFEKLIQGFHAMDGSNANSFKIISHLFLKGLNDPVNIARENAAAGLGMLVDHCVQQPAVLYKNINKNLWNSARRENNEVVRECICYGMILTIKRNIWQQPIKKLSTQLITFLPIRHIAEYNMTMVEFFKNICFNRPEDILPIIKNIYKYLLEILENTTDSDVDPLYKQALSLASKLYSMHLEELQQITINPLLMEAILCAYKNKTCLKTVLRLKD